jgi:uncharacterized protein (TIGR02594 family)
MKKFLTEAKKLLGKHEVRDNKVVMKFLNDNLDKKINPAKTAWCAAFVNAILNKLGYSGTNSFLARSFLKWGVKVPVSEMKPGDIVVLKRGRLPWQGHVALLVKSNSRTVTLRGGNQANMVNDKAYPSSSILGVRRPSK